MTETQPSVQLLSRVKGGETEAMAILYERYGAAVYGIALRLTRSTADAEDILQDVFLGLPEAMRSYQGSGSFAGWIRKVAARTALMKLRRRRIRAEVSLDQVGNPSWARQGLLPEDQMTLETALNAIPEPQRTVFVLKAVEGYSHAEIGAMLGITELAARARYHRAVCKIRSLIGPQP